MIESIHGEHPSAVHHNSIAQYKLVDNKHQLVVEGIPTAIITPKSNSYLQYGESYIREATFAAPRGAKLALIPQIHGITDGLEHSNTQVERAEMEAFQRQGIKTSVQPTDNGSQEGLRNMD